MVQMNSFPPLGATSSTDSTASIELGDYLVCHHGSERCELCSVDHREDNAFTAGIDPVASREGITVEITYDKDGIVQCKKHKAKDCGQCHGMKKQIIKASKDAVKAASKVKGSTSNFV